ncbi:adenylate/guanylate cyclase domain-containing protein [Nocardioides humilatus]|uniref:Adenylate/guanylate cyclase domain-containing protein n=1 Tax=Nocardioides humilatus TaxID=2607660 RepID=A0A5B1LAS1_9ACTN|nr:adenylate/guanylate cyclase domain-containing protein [Nocardioides humilatus]KAA1416767.1 adenylate/guanylate cyclase domain-containing protein [Nocardioides humilatus]
MPAAPRIGYAPRGGGAHIGYAVFGEGPPLISWVGGTVTASSVFDEPRLARFMREAGTFCTRILIDRRGMGYSDPLPPGAVPTLEDQVGDLLAVMDQLDLDNPAVSGNAWDSQAVLQMAVTHPDRVSRLVLTSTTPFPGVAPGWEGGVRVEVIEQLAKEYDRPGQGLGPARILDVLAPSLADDDALEEWMAAAGRVSPATARAYTEMAFASDVRAVLPEITAPTLILHSTRDRWTPLAGARFMAAEIPGARLVEYDSDNHLLFCDHVDEKLAETEAFIRGDQPVHAQRRLLTVLFTDVVGSTERLSATPDLKWTALLDEVDSTVSRQVQRHNGRVCKSMGDGHLAVFERPSDAVAAALGIGRSLRLLGVEIRAGAHIGEIELRGDDIAGIAVHVGARVSGKAGAGEILVTRTVADLLAGSPYRCEPAGEFELKGLQGSWALVRVS